MISQADIIRTLVNKNCTDESIFSTALSPNCTPAKLLEKFTEAECFDLALDVSMRLGLDTAPLWKTWAMRCLKNRNFQAARDKFKLCFQRLKPQSGRPSIGLVSSELLSEILSELARMGENKLSLNEEIELIKKLPDAQGDIHIKATDPKTDGILNRPTIYSECLYYLQEYGTVKDHIGFFVEHSLWNLVVDYLLENRTSLSKDRFFITDVFLRSASMGYLENFISEILKRDPTVDLSRQYFKAIYDHCSSHCLYNLLNYIQHKVGDYVAAAESQINHYFLEKPAHSYKELSRRLPSLTKAIEDYREYLKRLNVRKHTISMKNDLKRKDIVKNDLFNEMNQYNVEKRISTIELQIDITKNFAINEVSGCISEIEPDVENDLMRAGNSFPVTLFDRSERRKTFLVALVLIYFDLECNRYFSSSGFDLARRLVHKLQLNKLEVYKTAMRIIIEDESCDILKSTGLLLERLKQDYEEDVKLFKKHPASSRKHSLPHISSQNQHSIQQVNKRNEKASKIPTQAPSSLHESEKISLFSNYSTLSTFTTASSSTAASSSASSFSSTSSSTLLQPQQQLSSPPPAPISTSVSVSNMKPQQLADATRAQAMRVSAPSNRRQESTPSTGAATVSFQAQNISSRLSFDSSATSPIMFSHEAKMVAKKTTSPSQLPSGPAAIAAGACPASSLCMFECADALCDEVVRDSIKSCREADYKMELAKFLSPQAWIELFIELGKLSNAQRLAFSMDRADYVMRIMEEADKLKQDYVKTVCQHWLAKHETYGASSLKPHQQQHWQGP